MRLKRHVRSDRILIDAVDPGGIAVQHKDIFNVDDLIYRMHEWLVDNGWGEPSDADFGEVFYFQKFMQGGASEVKIWWRYKKPQNNLITFHFDVQTMIFALKSAEVMHRGMKFKTHNGDAEVRIWAYLDIDPDRAYRDHWLLGGLFTTFKDRIYLGQIKQAKNYLRFEANRYRNALKEFFMMKSYTSMPHDERLAHNIEHR